MLPLTAMRRGLWTFAAGVALLTWNSAAAEPSLPGYTLIETITVPTNGTSTYSATVLSSGVTYRLSASGAFDIGGYMADAEYVYTGTDSYDYYVYGTVDVCDYGIAVNDTSVGGLKLPFWGAYNSAHEYEVDFQGLGAPIGLSYHDDNVYDNVSSLTLRIYQPVPEPATLSVLTLAGLAAAKKRH